jgi:hypothetical protein
VYEFVVGVGRERKREYPLPRSTSERLARAVYGAQTQAAASWANQACELLVQGKSEQLVAAIAVLPSVPREPGESRRLPEKAMDSLSSNAERMRSPAFRATSACMWAVARLQRLVKPL